jgi:hypothetical protein
MNWCAFCALENGAQPSLAESDFDILEKMLFRYLNGNNERICLLIFLFT